MAVTKRSVKGSALTMAEVDANWDELNGLLTRLAAFVASQTPGNGEIVVTGASGQVTLGGTLYVGCSSGSGKVRIKGGNANTVILDNDGTQYTELILANNGGNKVNFYWDNTNKASVLNVSEATSKIRLYAAGTGGVELSAGATSWSSLSDERHKDLIELIPDASKKLAGIRSVIGKYKTDPEGTRRVFFVAQDFLDVLPEAVDTDKDGVYTLRYTDAIPLIAAAVNEHEERLAALEAKL